MRSIAFIVGVFLLVFSLTMVIPTVTNKYLGLRMENFLAGFVITCTSGGIFVLLGKLSRLNGGMPVVFAITPVVLGLLFPICRAIPFYLDSLDYVDVSLKTISGFTTTGATVFSDVGKLSSGILLWRAMLGSIGGFSIQITIGIAVLRSGVLSLNNLLYSECSDATKRRLPNTRSVVIHATAVYYGLILLCIFSII